MLSVPTGPTAAHTFNSNLLHDFKDFEAASELTNQSFENFNVAHCATQSVRRTTEERLCLSMQDTEKLRQLLQYNHFQTPRAK